MTPFSLTDAERALRGEKKRPAELRLTLRNELGELARVNDLASELLESCGADEHAVYATQLALEEVLSNVIRHGHPDGGHHEIALALRAEKGGVELEIVDEGRDFDPTSAPGVDLDVPLAQRRAGGLGIHLVRAYAREIRHERHEGRNFLWLRI